jgi:hypothetical protein
VAELGLNQDYKDLLVCLSDVGAESPALSKRKRARAPRRITSIDMSAPPRFHPSVSDGFGDSLLG